MAENPPDLRWNLDGSGAVDLAVVFFASLCRRLDSDDFGGGICLGAHGLFLSSFSKVE